MNTKNSPGDAVRPAAHPRTHVLRLFPAVLALLLTSGGVITSEAAAGLTSAEASASHGSDLLDAQEFDDPLTGLQQPLQFCETAGKPFIELVAANGGTGSRWCAEWDDPNLSLAWDPSTAGSTRGNRGTLIKTVTFKTLTPIAIRFKQKSPQALPNEFGLRLTMREFVTNQSGAGWGLFSEVLNDSSVGGDCFRGHPSVAHFHDDNLDVSPTNTGTRTTGGFARASISSTSPVLTKMNLLVASGGAGVRQNQAWFPTGIGIHECESNRQLREFVLLEGPLPVTNF